MLPRWSQLLAVGILAGLHLLIGLWPGELMETPTNLVLFAANLYVLWCGGMLLRDRPGPALGLYVAGYGLLFALVVVLLQRESLFVLLIIVYASVFRLPLLLGVFCAFVLGYVVFQPYAFETFAPLALAWAVIWQLWRRGVSRFLIACLGAGLLFLALLLLPILHLMVQDSPQTLLVTLGRSEVREALWLSLATSGTATLIVVLFGVPLAYALARIDFPGKGVVESLIDLPILIPKPVVGIGLLVMLGPGAPLGQALEAVGLGVTGRFAGVVLAQVFVSCPFLIKTAATAFEGVPEVHESVARTLGASPRQAFLRVALPLASRGVMAGVILCWARAIGEFGAIVLFSPHPLTAPVLVYNEFLKAGVSESRPLAVLLMMICLWVFVLLQFGRTFLPAPLRRGAIAGVR